MPKRENDREGFAKLAGSQPGITTSSADGMPLAREPAWVNAQSPFAWEAHVSIVRTLAICLLGAAICFVSYLLTTHIERKAQVAGWLGIAFFPLATLAGMRHLFYRGPVVTIDLEGILDRRFGVGRIPWDDIALVFELSVKSQRFLSIQLKDEASYLRRMPVRARLLAKINAAFGFSPFTISFTPLNRSFNDAWSHFEIVQQALKTQAK